MFFTSACNVSFLFNTILFVELINTAASGADFHVDTLVRRTCYKCVPAVAGHCCLMVLWMDSFAHDFHLSILK